MAGNPRAISGALVLALLALSFTALPAAAAGPSYLTGWSHRQAFEITNPDVAPATKEIALQLDSAGLVGDGLLQADCDDLRIAAADGTTLLPLFLEGSCGSATFFVWTKLTLAAGETATVYVYHGNPAAASASSASSVFTPGMALFGGSCTSSSLCGYTDNAAEMNAVRALPADHCADVTITHLAGGQRCSGAPGDQFYNRVRFLFAPTTAGTYTFQQWSDDAGEISKSPGDATAGAMLSVVGADYGAHGFCCGGGGSIAIPSGSGVWIDYAYVEWFGGEHGEVRVGGTAVSTASFPGQVYRRSYSGPAFEVEAVSVPLTGGDGQFWAMDDTGLLTDIAYRNACPEASSIEIREGVTQKWVVNEAAATTVDFGTGMDWRYQLTLARAFTGTFDLAIGVWDGSSFTALGSVTIGPGGSGVLAGAISVPGAFLIPQGDHLAIQIVNTPEPTTANANKVVLETGGACTELASYVVSPVSDPGYPTPELATLLLFGTGMLVVAAIVIARRR